MLKLIQAICKVDKLNVEKLSPVTVDLSKLNDVVKMILLKKHVYNAKVQNIEDKIPDITNFSANSSLDAKINEVKGKITSTINLATNAFLNAKTDQVKDEIPNITN